MAQEEKVTKFIKNPIEIDAFRIGIDPWPDWFHDKVSSNEITTHPVEGEIESGPFGTTKIYCLIKTKEGIMKGEYGDFIIKEPFPINDRNVYPCKPDIFEKTYSSKLCVAPNTSLSLQECKDKFAKQFGYDSWKQYKQDFPTTNDEIWSQIAEIYAASNRVEEKEAIRFLKWISGNNYHQLNGSIMFIQPEERLVKQYSAEELYSLYKTQKA